jgi:CRP-like cAMP-binding protein
MVGFRTNLMTNKKFHSLYENVPENSTCFHPALKWFAWAAHQGDFLFKEGDAAVSFYTLIKGSVRLSIGEAGRPVYSVSHAGEAFGWSSLIGRDVYSVSAECIESTTVMNIDKERFLKIMEQDPASALLFFKHLSATLGKRLLQCYEMFTASTQSPLSVSYGTGQVVDQVEFE